MTISSIRCGCGCGCIPSASPFGASDGTQWRRTGRQLKLDEGGNGPNMNDRAMHNSPLSRRRFLWQTGGGFGGIALAQMLGAGQLLAGTTRPKPEYNGGLHHPAKVKRIVQLFMNGGASQMDTFDYKP